MNIKRMFSTIDTHVAGEAFRIVIHSPIVLNEENIKANDAKLQRQFSEEKAILLNEPRGHRNMHGCIVLPSEKAHFGLLFFHHAPSPSFKYGGLVATITALLELGHLNKEEDDQYTVETVEGIITLKADFLAGEVKAVHLSNKMCELQLMEDYVMITVDQKRRYPLFERTEEMPLLTLKHLSELQKWGKETLKLFLKTHSLKGLILFERLENDTFKSVTFERDGSILRSPGFDTTFALFTYLQNKKQKDAIENVSIFNSSLKVKQDGERGLMTAQGFVTSSSQFIVDPEDPLYRGFLLS